MHDVQTDHPLTLHVPGEGWYCRTRKHVWLSQDDAEKCCDINWKRILVFGGGTHQQECEGTRVGRAWLRAWEP